MGALERQSVCYIYIIIIIFPVGFSFVLSPFQYHNALQKDQMRYHLLRVRATLYACFLPCLIQLFFEKFQREARNSIEIFRKIIELDKAEKRRIK